MSDEEMGSLGADAETGGRGDAEIGPDGSDGSDAIAQTDTPEFSEEQLRLFPALAAQMEAEKQLDLDLGLPDVPLPLHYQLFVQAYCVNGFHGGPAVLQSGYLKANGLPPTPDEANVYACRWLKRAKIQAFMAKELAGLIADGRFSKDALLTKLRSIIHANAADFVEGTTDGLELKDLTTLSPDQTAAIKKLTMNTTERTKSGKTTRESTVNIELLDPLRAIEIAAKMLDLITEKMDMTSGGKALPAGGSTVITVVREASGIATEAESG